MAEDAPPSYGKCIRAQTLPIQHAAVFELTTPPGMGIEFTQPAPAPGPVYRVVETLPAPHSFLGLSFTVLFICGIFSCTTLLCGCIALAFSHRSDTSNRHKQYANANRYGNMALGFSMAAIVWGFVGIIISIGVISQVFPGFRFPCICFYCQCPPPLQPNY